ncbi:NAD(P)-binding protein [Lepidopterella palustris CBS 459.81]|uniref:NAD(P)-binding protein n=1 Tax=Lepidopterella palustris CBS 459.81 TaxID=1314670 RepID=A0A8E2E2N1_9PEZI|nr:NAD(P)-binding protein [Lepidopterella palustris CBS 459.81]
MGENIVIAGGTGNVAREVIEAILARDMHNVIVFTRKSRHSAGVDAILSFIVVYRDPGNVAQKNLIDAAIEAGVMRFAPSEWGFKSYDGLPSMHGKEEARRYLEDINEDKKVLEYTLFQPGLFLDYFAHPYAPTRYLTTFCTQLDFEHRGSIQIDDGSHPVVLTLVSDVAAIVSLAIEYKGEWPVVGGIKGSRTSDAELLKLGEELRGPFKADTVSEDDIMNGVLYSSWVPKIDHPSIPLG